MLSPRALISAALRTLVALAAVAAVTSAGFRVVQANATTMGFLYLVTILLIARSWGLVESVAASFAAGICLNFYFLPPILRFTIADPRNWVALCSFLMTAILVSKLSTTARLQTQTALDRQGEMEKLYALSRGILLIDSSGSVAKQAAMQIARAFGFSAVSLYERSTSEIHRAGVDDLDEWDDRLRAVALQGTFLTDAATSTVATAIRLGAEPIGSLALRGKALPDSALQSLVNLVAIALERARTVEAANRADVARQSEELKSTLLDAIAHEFKTPLTSIKAAATALLPSLEADMARKELVTIVDEEADRLGRLVTEAIQMARIEAGRVHLNRRPESVERIISRALDVISAGESEHPVQVDVPTDLPAVELDAELIELSMRLLIDNAVKYSPAGMPIAVKARLDGLRLILSVHNEGPGIPEAELGRIFNKFYRASGTSQQIPGTGMGLAIAREIVQAHQGQIWVESSPGLGTQFSISVPLGSQALTPEELSA